MASYTLHHKTLFFPVASSKTLISKPTKLGFPSPPKTLISRSLICRDSLRPAIDDNPEAIISGEWPENISLVGYEDLRAYLEAQIISEKVCFTDTNATQDTANVSVCVSRDLVCGCVARYVSDVQRHYLFASQVSSSSLLGEVMSVPVKAVTADMTLEEIEGEFEKVSGLPVVDAELRCIGVVSKKDKKKALHGMKSKVGEVMSSPAITLTPDKTVMDAAALMLKEKIHRIPLLNEDQQIIGIVTRSDIFQALEAEV